MSAIAQLTPPISWKLEFARSADAERYREIVRKAREEAVREEKRRDGKEKDEKADADELIELAVFATVAELDAFEVTIDRYDAATYEALIANEQALSELRREREEMLDKAFVLPDGRRVFESEDGIRVFDEFGRELDSSVITPEEIEDWRPKAESYQANGDAYAAREAERQALLDYQQELADAREQAKDGEITSDELKALERQLAADMPDAVRDRLAPEHRPSQPEQDQAAAPEHQVAQQPAPIRDVPVF